VEAHFPYVLLGGLLFPIFAALYYSFPKATGRLPDERLGRRHYWHFLLGINLTFAPLHFAGFAGMPRRIYTYEAGRGFDLWNQLASLGVVFQAAAILCFLWNVVHSLRRGRPAGPDPWDAWTLEWATSSPPPAYNFETPPVVRSRRPLWDLKHPQDPDWRYE
jgi:cytochrome c oxidase subunit 1